MDRVYIVLSTSGVGGAEKRFADNWHALHCKGLDVHLVMDRSTWIALREQAGYAEKMVPSDRLHVLDLGGGHYKAYCIAVHRFFSSQPRRCIVHFPIAHVPGLKLRFGHRLVVSWVNSAMPPFRQGRWRLGAGAWLGFLSASYVDVLNPNNLQAINRIRSMHRKTGLTAGGTQVDSRRYGPLQKGLDFVFLGRLEPEKQALRFVKLLPMVHQALKAHGFAGYRFVICGDGSEAAQIRAVLDTEAFPDDLSVTVGYSAQPERVLGQADVYFSLQKTSNYPSKALAEAMVCGAFPVLTQVGESDLMVACVPEHHAYVPQDFGADDLARVLMTYLRMTPDARANMSATIANSARERFGMEAQPKYFESIYRSVSRATPDGREHAR